MKESIVNFVVFVPICELDRDYYKYIYPKLDDPEWQKQNSGTVKAIDERILEYKNIFKGFLDQVREGEYYFFITNTGQHPRMEKTIEKYNLRNNLVWCSKQAATNLIHPLAGPALKCWLFKF